MVKWQMNSLMVSSIGLGPRMEPGGEPGGTINWICLQRHTHIEPLKTVCYWKNMK